MIRAHIRKRFQDFELLLDLETGAAEVTVLYGASGAGKTLTLDCLAGFVKPDSGRILLDDRILFDAAAQVNLLPQRRQCGYVFQDHALFPHMTVRQNLLFAAEGLPRLNRHRRVAETMELFRISEFAASRPQQLSGGQKQRCSIARALIGYPRLLLLDEPAQGLDVALRNELYDIVRKVRSEYRIPILLVTHDLNECFALGTTMLVLQAGRILQSGTPASVYARPTSADVARLLGIANLYEVMIVALDPGRNTSVLRLLEHEVSGEYLPGRLIGDIVQVAIPAASLKVTCEAGPNCIQARLIQITELSDTVRLQFEPGLTVELSRKDFHAHPPDKEWFVAIPSNAFNAGV